MVTAPKTWQNWDDVFIQEDSSGQNLSSRYCWDNFEVAPPVSLRWKWQSWRGASSWAAHWKWLKEAQEHWEFIPGVYKTFMESLWLEKTSGIPNSNQLVCNCPHALELLIIPLWIQTIRDNFSLSCVNPWRFPGLRRDDPASDSPPELPLLRSIRQGAAELFSMEIRARNQWALSGSSGAGRAPAALPGRNLGWSAGEADPEPCGARRFHCGRKWGQAQPLRTGIVCWKGSAGAFLFFLEALCRLGASLENVPFFWKWEPWQCFVRCLGWSRTQLRAHFYSMDWVYLV